MALDVVVTSDRLARDPSSRSLIEYLQRHSADLGLQTAVLWYDFPVYTDYGTTSHRPDLLLFSPSHGFVAIRFGTETLFSRDQLDIVEIDQSLGDFSSNLYSRLLRSRELRESRSKLIIDVFPIVFLDAANAAEIDEDEIDSQICSSYEGLADYLTRLRHEPIDPRLAAEVRSVVEGAKALTRPQKRTVEDPARQPLAVAMARLEAEIANFDEKQRRVALVEVGGPARIRGLAGSGKTVILAMKAAHIHLTRPDERILVTFFTRGLRSTLKNLITKFYRHYSESDPDWDQIHIRHGWGGARTPGVYADACRRANSSPLDLRRAQSIAKGGDAFGAACADLLATSTPSPYYDYLLIDEGQDFPSSFYELCYKITKGEQDRKNIIWAYDELQNILDVQIRSPEVLFGRDEQNVPRVLLDRSARFAPTGASNDVVLSKCYRNQRSVLVAAHALGFGVYGSIVQLLESAGHWQDVGYEVLTGELVTGEPVVVNRPAENSPLEIEAGPAFPLIGWAGHNNFDDEVSWVVEGVASFIAGGLLHRWRPYAGRNPCCVVG